MAVMSRSKRGPWLARRESVASKVAVLDEFALKTGMDLAGYITMQMIVQRPDVYDVMPVYASRDKGHIVLITPRVRLNQPKTVYLVPPNEQLRRPDAIEKGRLVWRGPGVSLSIRRYRKTHELTLSWRCDRLDWTDEHGYEDVQDVCHSVQKLPTYSLMFSEWGAASHALLARDARGPKNYKSDPWLGTSPFGEEGTARLKPMITP